MKKLSILSIAGSVLAFVLATSCCWLPVLFTLLVGGTIGASAFWTGIEAFSGIFITIGVALAAYAGWQIFKQKSRQPLKPVLQSFLTCPECGFQKMETMPTNACQYFYECENCHQVLKPLSGDCCVFCSYGTMKCPPVQAGDTNCCA